MNDRMKIAALLCRIHEMAEDVEIRLDSGDSDRQMIAEDALGYLNDIYDAVAELHPGGASR